MKEEAVILAGGFGTRLRDVVADVPKSMAIINGKPFLEYLLGYLHSFGITKAVLSVGYLNEKIISYFGSRYKNIDLHYSIEEEPLGTGGAVKMAMDYVTSENVLVLNGDTIFDIDLDYFCNFHSHKEADISLALRMVTDGGRYGSVIINSNNRIEGFAEKKQDASLSLINGGVYLINKSYFSSLDLPEKFSLEKDCFEKLYKTAGIYGYKSEEYFLDIGIPEDYQKAQDEFKRFENR